MEQTNDAITMLELMDRSAFCVKDGVVVGANDAARKHGICTDMDILPLLLTGAQEYADFKGGCLYLTIKIEGLPHEASVTELGEYHLFRLEQEEIRQDLQVMALAAKELRQPLANVMAIADRLYPLQSTEDDPQLQDQFARINRGLYQMLRIISNMSDAYRYCLDMNPTMQVRNISSIVKEAIDSATPLIEQTGLEICYKDCADDIYSLVNSEKLERAISNMLSNALKFSPKEGKIDVSLSRRERMLYLTIKNSNNDIEDRRSDIYDRYHRRPGIEDSRFGIGLGMVLIRSAAAAHGGTVLLEQSPQHGTSVTMTMMIRQNAPMVRTNTLHVDYAGERDHLLLELSESLPSDLYKK